MVFERSKLFQTNELKNHMGKKTTYQCAFFALKDFEFKWYQMYYS